MRNRNHHIQVWLNDEEMAVLTERVKQCGLCRETYLRQLIAGYAPQPLPPADYISFMRELRRVGNTLNQIARKAHGVGRLDAQRYDDACQSINKLICDVTEAVVLPGKQRWQ